jgi:hypothetical protein
VTLRSCASELCRACPLSFPQQEPSQRSEIVEERFAPTHVNFELVQHVNSHAQGI